MERLRSREAKNGAAMPRCSRHGRTSPGGNAPGHGIETTRSVLRSDRSWPRDPEGSRKPCRFRCHPTSSRTSRTAPARRAAASPARTGRQRSGGNPGRSDRHIASARRSRLVPKQAAFQPFLPPARWSSGGLDVWRGGPRSSSAVQIGTFSTSHLLHRPTARGRPRGVRASLETTRDRASTPSSR